MSKGSFSLDLSEYFNDDDSNGHRLAEFLQKRRGGALTQKLLFVESEPMRLSVDVQLERLDDKKDSDTRSDTPEKINEVDEEEIFKSPEAVIVNSPEKDIAETPEKETRKSPAKDTVKTTEEKIVKLPEKQSSKSRDKESYNSPIEEIVKSPEKEVIKSPLKLETEKEKQNDMKINLKPLDVGGGSSNTSNTDKPPLNNDKPVSPRVKAIRKSGGGKVSPSDRLRRYSLNRLAKLSCGRRTLLRDFEDTLTDSNFAPPIFSTPMSQPSSESPPGSAPITPTNVENVAPNISPIKNASKKGPTDETFTWTHSGQTETQNKNLDLRQMMESIVETTLKRVQSQSKKEEEQTLKEKEISINKSYDKGSEKNSTLRRTYTVEKGEKPGQVILTPDVPATSPLSIAMDLSSFLERNNSNSKRNVPLSANRQSISKTPERRPITPQYSPVSSRRSLDFHGDQVVDLSPISGKRYSETLLYCDDMDISPRFNLSDNKGNSNNTVIRSPQRTRNCNQLTISFDSPSRAYSTQRNTLQSRENSLRTKRCSVMMKTIRNIEDMRLSKANTELDTTPPPSAQPSPIASPRTPHSLHKGNQTNSDVIYEQNEEELYIPETQDVPMTNETSICITLDQVPVVVIPVNQTRTTSKENESCHENCQVKNKTLGSEHNVDATVVLRPEAEKSKHKILDNEAEKSQHTICLENERFNSLSNTLNKVKSPSKVPQTEREISQHKILPGNERFNSLSNKSNILKSPPRKFLRSDAEKSQHIMLTENKRPNSFSNTSHKEKSPPRNVLQQEAEKSQHIILTGNERSSLQLNASSKVISPSKVTLTEGEKSQHIILTGNERPNSPVTVLETEQNINDDAIDNLKLTDILTDDEDEPRSNTMSESVLANSQVPLNLAVSEERIKRLRKRSVSSRRMAEAAKLRNMSTDVEQEPLPLSLRHSTVNRRKSIKRQKRPLNKAPGAPLNGEEFAKELARMSNYEILDLRKRNSLGRIFPISGRKSVWEREEAIKKQVMLDDEIQMELLRRNMEIAKNENVEIVEDDVQIDITTNNDNMESEPLFPPVPLEFSDDTNAIDKPVEVVRESSLVDERSCDRVSFNSRKDSLKQRNRKKSVPDVLQNYLRVSEKFTSKKKKKRSSINKSKRSLYTRGFSDSEETLCQTSNEKQDGGNISTSQSLPCVPSPPRSETDQMPSLKVVSPPPPLSRSLEENLHRTIGVETDLQASMLQLALPPPPNFESDSGVDTNGSTQVNPNVSSNVTTDNVFKKPLPPPPAKKKKLTRQKAIERAESVENNNVSAVTSESSSDMSEGGSLRRSKRAHNPSQVGFLHCMFQQSLTKRITEIQNQLKENKNKKQKKLDGSQGKKDQNTFGEIKNDENKENKTESSPKTKRKPRRKPKPLEPIVEQNGGNEIPEIINTNTKEKRTKTKRRANKKKQEEAAAENVEYSRILLNTPPPLDHFNNVFDQLRNSSSVSEERPSKENEVPQEKPATKKLRVRVARLKPNNINSMKSNSNVSNSISRNHNQHANDIESVSSVSSTNDTKQSNFELISWLKNITEAETTQRNEAIFKEMRISSASNLSFTELQGVEYAFYETDDQASLGYLRFKPRQKKPRKRAKRYHLHFVTLVGQFRITANDKESLVGPGDMVAIEKTVYYDIENLSNDIGILMVIKK